MKHTRTKYFQGREPNLTQFEALCIGRGLNQCDILNDLIAQFLKENDNGQTTLSGFPQEPKRLAVFERAQLIAARSELGRILENMERAPENRPLFQVDLAKALKTIEPIYTRTRDPGLLKLLQAAEAQLQ